ncbi:hypothetical protein CARUB_v10011548mg [Capsella rubella]|uniref:Transmembrane protein n=1 Tax=Capsella rubella TaxID=81985 RepID=R0IPE5_9BRAS|nr:uncharacterized protein LOC17899069 [Capsella rubella]EOA39008.1 hypothetical protein CARUB_v10011548mg [Capsella rubella]
METKSEEKPSVIELLKRAAKLLFCNINLFLFICLCSLPLFCFLIFFELSLQTTFAYASQFLFKLLTFREDLSENDLIIISEKKNDLIPWLVQTILLYFFPYSILDLFTTSTIVAASSIVYTSEEEPLGILHLLRRSLKVCQNRVEGLLITSLYVLLWSTSVLVFFFLFFFLQLLSGSKNYLYIPHLSRVYVRFHYQPTGLSDVIVILTLLFQCAFFIFLTAKFSKWSAGWNMGLVVSVLEDDEDGLGIYGSDAMSLSAWYRKGHEKRDLWLMLMFLVFALAMRMPCLYSKCSESSSGNGVLYTGVYVGLICVGNVLKWLTCLACYYDCKTRVLRKKRDVEQAKPPAT